MAQGQRIVEVLKQRNNSPVEVAHQVCIFYAATKGYLDCVEVESVGAYEQGLYPFLDERYYEMLEQIRTTGKLDEETESKLKEALQDYGSVFQNT